jgi:hypothetical protein
MKLPDRMAAIRNVFKLRGQDFQKEPETMFLPICDGRRATRRLSKRRGRRHIDVIRNRMELSNITIR